MIWKCCKYISEQKGTYAIQLDPAKTQYFTIGSTKVAYNILDVNLQVCCEYLIECLSRLPCLRLLLYERR